MNAETSKETESTEKEETGNETGTRENDDSLQGDEDVADDIVAGTDGYALSEEQYETIIQQTDAIAAQETFQSIALSIVIGLLVAICFFRGLNN